MKTFETPEIEILRFAVEDIITTSGDNEFPFTPLGEDNLGIVEIG